MGTEASSFRDLDRIDFPRFNLLGSPRRLIPSSNIPNKGSDQTMEVTLSDLKSKTR